MAPRGCTKTFWSGQSDSQQVFPRSWLWNLLTSSTQPKYPPLFLSPTQTPHGAHSSAEALNSLGSHLPQLQPRVIFLCAECDSRSPTHFVTNFLGFPTGTGYVIAGLSAKWKWDDPSSTFSRITRQHEEISQAWGPSKYMGLWDRPDGRPLPQSAVLHWL